MSVKIAVKKDLQGYSCIVQVKNRNEDQLGIIGISPLVIETDDSSVVSTGWDGTELRYFHNGFHSWEMSQSRDLSEGINISHWFSVIHNTKSSETILNGFVTMADQLSTIEYLGRKAKKNRLLRQ